MSEQTDAPQGGAEGVDTSAAVETNPEATTGQLEAGADNPTNADDAGAEPEPKRVPWFQKRIDEVTARKYEAEREAAYWRGQAEAKARHEAPQPQAAAPELTLEQFNYDEAAYAKAIREQAIKDAETSIDRKLTEREQRAAVEQKNTTALTKLQEAAAARPDFVAAVSDLPVNDAIRDFILEEPKAADVLYELGKDTAAAARFNSLPLHLQALELGRRAATVSAPKATARPIPPTPPQTVGGLSAGMAKPADQMTMAEYAAARKAGNL